ncbi:hypothetical protein PGTUg99_033514 [Puccinia graminis f. sp. tritici]|uniref:Uncharacterized protein n=1 Tax=Puccinia graminis f. sp. tritici TaxID=56615 RepID=A0A5B0Q8M0_PUCGR|nr:hypothetical protein PGTUg99_033514 [Puccinia graminis f. sp. tritici]
MECQFHHIFAFLLTITLMGQWIAPVLGSEFVAKPNQVSWLHLDSMKQNNIDDPESVCCYNYGNRWILKNHAQRSIKLSIVKEGKNIKTFELAPGKVFVETDIPMSENLTLIRETN